MAIDMDMAHTVATKNQVVDSAMAQVPSFVVAQVVAKLTTQVGR